MNHLFTPLNLKSLTLRNRIGVSPMCQYSCKDGFATDWHLVHLGSRAVGGAGLVMMEATAVTPEGRISDGDNGIWSDAHVEMLSRITAFIKQQGSAAAIQLAHAGRKASRAVPWAGDRALSKDEGGWTVIAPSAIAYSESYQTPEAMSLEKIQSTVNDFALAAKRALAAGFQIAEIHGAHGYLINNFLSPISNQRTDAYGGSFENRIRFLRDITRTVRKIWPDSLPLFVRLSCSDWTAGGWTGEDSVALAGILKAEGVDLIDCSSGGTSPEQKIPVGANYQVPFAAALKKQSEIPTAAVGLITEPMQADAIIRNGEADLIFLAREFLRDPYWPLHAHRKLHARTEAPVPKQYGRAFG